MIPFQHYVNVNSKGFFLERIIKILHPGHQFLHVILKNHTEIRVYSLIHCCQTGALKDPCECEVISVKAEVWPHFTDSTFRECTRFHKVLKVDFPCFVEHVWNEVACKWPSRPQSWNVLCVFRDEGNFSLTWLRISGLSLNTAHQISQKKHVPAKIWPRCREIHTLQDPSSSCALHPSVHTRVIPVILKVVYLDFICIYILEGDTSSATTLHSRWKDPVLPPLLDSPFWVTLATFLQHVLQFK